MERPKLRPVVWNPPPIPERARQSSGSRPMPPLRVLEVGGAGPEDVAIDADGYVLTGIDDGRVIRISPDGRDITTRAATGGRPLGIEVADDGSLVVCDARRGLLRVRKDGAVETLVAEVAGEPLVFCNNAAVAADGTIYFSDSSRRFGIDHWKAEVLEHSGTGRLLRRDPDGTVELLREGLQFANGIALSPDNTFLLYAETCAYRITRLWLTGSRAGQTEIFADNLPGFPDNMSTGSDGLFWVAMPVPRDRLVDRLAKLPPYVRQAVWALPERLQPAPQRTVWAVAFDEAGKVVHDLQGPGDRFHMVTGVREHDREVYLGSLADSAIAVMSVGDGAAPSVTS